MEKGSDSGVRGEPDKAERTIMRSMAGQSSSLKTLPPRSPPSFLVRGHLSLERMLAAGLHVIEICAPHGFGKTSQLAQWYREALVSGRQAMWVSIDSRDDAATVVACLADAAARLSRSDAFSPAFLAWVASCADPQQAITAWLAETAQMPGETILLLDDADHASSQARPAIEYLIANAPANLRIAVSLRPNGTFADSGLLSSIPMMRITARELRLGEEETVRLVRQIAEIGMRGEDLDQFAIELQRHAAGWPLGVRLGIAARLRSPDSASDARNMADIGNYMLSQVVDRQPSDVAMMLTYAAHLDPIHPRLLDTVLGVDNAEETLTRLAAETPIVVSDGSGGWFHLHPSAREALTGRQAGLPPEELRKNAFNASNWYAEHGLLEEAANQAEIAGDTQRAVQLAEASLRRLIDLGRNAEIVAWLGRIASAEIETRPRFWAPAGWALANTNRGEEARSFAEAIRNNPNAGELERYEADLIQSAASAHNDDHDNWDLLPQRWPAPPKYAEPSQIVIHSVSLAHRAILSGRPETGRQCLNMPLIAPNPSRPIAPVSLSFAEALRGLSYLWEGKPLTAAGILRQGLTSAEASMDRRSRAALTLAALLAEAALASGDAAEAARVLSQRSLIINRECIPEAVIASCTTLAELACDEGRQDRASDRISSLMEEGLARGSPRMQAAALNASAQLNARYGRLHTAGHDADRLEELCASLPASFHPAIRSFCLVQANLARATANCAAGNIAQLESAETAATKALDGANRLQRGADTARALFLRAKARDRLNQPSASEDMAEAKSICTAAGLVRLMSEFVSTAENASPLLVAPVQHRSLQPSPARQNGGLLTPREFDVVCHLASHMSNKEIAMAMGLGEETVKWHVKNLFQKLDAGDRKTVVRRARMVGIL